MSDESEKLGAETPRGLTTYTTGSLWTFDPEDKLPSVGVAGHHLVYLAADVTQHLAGIRQLVNSISAENELLRAALSERTRQRDEAYEGRDNERARCQATYAGQAKQVATLEAALERLTREKDELLTVLRSLSARHEGYENGMGRCVCASHEQARRLLALSEPRREP